MWRVPIPPKKVRKMIPVKLGNTRSPLCLQCTQLQGVFPIQTYGDWSCQREIWFQASPWHSWHWQMLAGVAARAVPEISRIWSFWTKTGQLRAWTSDGTSWHTFFWLIGKVGCSRLQWKVGRCWRVLARPSSGRNIIGLWIGIRSWKFQRECKSQSDLDWDEDEDEIVLQEDGNVYTIWVLCFSFSCFLTDRPPILMLTLAILWYCILYLCLWSCPASHLHVQYIYMLVSLYWLPIGLRYMCLAVLVFCLFCTLYLLYAWPCTNHMWASLCPTKFNKSYKTSLCTC
jgi:hypothetical protein